MIFWGKMLSMTLREARKILDVDPNRPFDGDLMDLYKVRDASFITGISMFTIRKRIRAGTISAWGRPFRIRPRDLLQKYQPPKTDPEAM